MSYYLEPEAPGIKNPQPASSRRCALQGRLSQDVGLLRRSARAAKDWCRLSVGVGEGEEVTWVSVSVFEEKARALAGLAKALRFTVRGAYS